MHPYIYIDIYSLYWHGARGGRKMDWEIGTVLQAQNDERAQGWWFQKRKRRADLRHAARKESVGVGDQLDMDGEEESKITPK